MHVPPEMHAQALSVLERAEGVTNAASVDAERGTLIATFESAWLAEQRGAGMNSAIRSLTDAEVPILFFELEGGRLSDAFLSLTAEGQQ